MSMIVSLIERKLSKFIFKIDVYKKHVCLSKKFQEHSIIIFHFTNYLLLKMMIYIKYDPYLLYL